MFDKHLLKDYCLLLLLCSFLYFSFLGSTRLWDWDEAINASTAREMFQKNDWIVPRFNDDLNYNKPIMVTLGIILSYCVFGVTEFAARLPSVFWSMGTVLLTYRIGLHLFGRPVAFRAGIILATMLMFCVEARAATPDAVLIFWTTAAIAIYVCGTFQALPPEILDSDSGALEQEGFRSRLRREKQYFPQNPCVVFLMYCAMGVAILAKGPIAGLLIPASVIGMFLLIKRLPDSSTDTALRSDWRSVFISTLRPFHPVHFLKTCGSMRLELGILAILLVAVPWYVWVGLKTDWQWPYVFFWKHNLGRAYAPMEGHKGPFYFYVGALMFGTFPWSIFFLPTIIDLVRRLRKGSPITDGLVFATCWSVVIIVAFSLAATKLPNYIATMFPAAAMIYAVYLTQWSNRRELVGAFWTPVALGVYAIVGTILTLLLAFLPVLAPTLLPGEGILAVIGVAALAGAITCIVYWSKNHSRPESRLVLQRIVFVSFLVFLCLVFFWAPVRLTKHQKYVEMFQEIRDQTPDARFVMVQCLEPSWVFYSGGPIPRISIAEADTYLQKQNNDTFLIVKENDVSALKKATSISLEEMLTVPYLFRQKNLVIYRSRHEQ